MSRARDLAKLSGLIISDADDDVGIGSTSPTAKLDVGGTGIVVGSGASVTTAGEAVFAGVCKLSTSSLKVSTTRFKRACNFSIKKGP